MPDHLTPPHGGTLVNLLVDSARAEAIRAESRDWPSWDLTPRQLCDLEMLLTGAFSPLTGFLNRNDYESVCESMRLSDGTLWPIPVTLDVPEDLADSLSSGSKLALRNPEGVMLAALTVEDVWEPDRSAEAEAVSEGIARFDVAGVVPAVADEEALCVSLRGVACAVVVRVLVEVFQ